MIVELGSDIVTPDWFPLFLVIVLLAVLGLLYWFMRRNLGRISVPRQADLVEGRPGSEDPTSKP